MEKIPLCPLSDVQGTSLNSVSLRSVPRSLIVQNLHNIIEAASQDTSEPISLNTSSHSKSSHSYHSIGGNVRDEEEDVGSSREEEDQDDKEEKEDSSHDNDQQPTSSSSLSKRRSNNRSIHEELKGKGCIPG